MSCIHCVKFISLYDHRIFASCLLILLGNGNRFPKRVRNGNIIWNEWERELPDGNGSIKCIPHDSRSPLSLEHCTQLPAVPLSPLLIFAAQIATTLTPNAFQRVGQPATLPLPVGGSRSHLILGSLGPPESILQSVTWSVLPFLRAHERQTDYATPSVAIGHI